MQPIPSSGKPWEDVALDFVTDLPCTAAGHDAVLVFVDRSTKMTHLEPCTTAITAAETFKLFERSVFKLHGLPRTIISDRGPQFVSEFWKELHRAQGTEVRLSTAYHPQSDGQSERTNRTMQQVLRHYVGPHQDDWDKLLPYVEFVLNNTVHESTKQTPFFLLYGCHPRSPLNCDYELLVPAAQSHHERARAALRDARVALEAAQQRQKHFADKTRTDRTFGIGDEVLLSTKNISLPVHKCHKFKPPFMGPYKIIQRVGAVAYKLQLPAASRIHNVFHVSLLRLYHPPADGRAVPPPPPIETASDGVFYTYEAILRHRTVGKRKQRQYLIKWKGYGADEDSWVAEANIPVPDLEVYWQGVPDAPTKFASALTRVPELRARAPPPLTDDAPTRRQLRRRASTRDRAERAAAVCVLY